MSSTTFLLHWGQHKITITVPEAAVTGDEALFVAERLRELARMVESKVLKRDPSAVAMLCGCPGCTARRGAERRVN